MKKVAIVGTAPSSVHAPFKDEAWDVWGVGARSAHFTRATRWYELHRLAGEPEKWAYDWREAMKKWSADCEVWMFYPEHDLGPKIVKMDPQPLVARYGTFFMTSSFSWMIAQAIVEGYDEIGLFGVDMEYGTEYKQQRIGLRHFIEVAKLSGVKLSRLTSSGIAYDPVPYPLWMDDPVLSKNKLRQKAHQEQIQNCKLTVEGFKNKVLKTMGVAEYLQEAIKVGLPLVPPDMQNELERRNREIAALNAASHTAQADLYKAEGAFEECRWLEDYLQP